MCGRGIAKRWKRRFFSLDPVQSCLFEFTSATKQSMTKIFRLALVTQLMLDGIFVEFLFDDDRRFKMRALTLEQASLWHSHLLQALQNALSFSPPTSSRPTPLVMPPHGLQPQLSAPAAAAYAVNMRPRSATDSPVPYYLQQQQQQQQQQRQAAAQSVDGGLHDARDHNEGSTSDDDADSAYESPLHSTGDLDSDADDSVAVAAKAPMPAVRTWGLTLRNMFSSSAHSQAETDSEGRAEAKDEPPVGPQAYEVSSHVVVEYDTVEVFENQRWLPISHWGTKMLLHDPASFTSRTGRPRADWFKASLQGDGRAAADSATTGIEDTAERSGSQVHVIRGDWEWVGPWKLAQLPALMAARPVAASIEGADEAANTADTLGSGGGGGGGGTASPPGTYVKRDSDHDQQWALGFDFPEFDYAIARGVARELPPSKVTQVRTRRWVRARRRQVTVIARIPPLLAPSLIVSLLDYNNQEMVTGYLGVQHRAGWRTRYFKLVRVCDGIWDAGRGMGLVARPATAALVVMFDSKERQQRLKEYQLDAHSVAALYTPLLLGEDASPALDLSVRFVEPEVGEAPLIAEPRQGRFTCTFRHRVDHVVFTADSRAEALRWVRAIGALVKELAASEAAAAAAAATPEPSTPRKLGGLSLRFPHRERAKSVTKEEHGDDSEDAAAAAATGVVVREDTGEEPMPVADSLTAPRAFEAGHLKEVIDVVLPLNPRAFFQAFIGDKAPAGLPDFHSEFGDDAVHATLWSTAVPAEARAKDDFDLDGWDVCPERVITFRAMTNSTIPPPVTRAEKHMRYWWYAGDKTLVVKAATRSLDVPMGDSFFVVELWVVTPEADGARSHVRVLMDVPFSKSFNPLKGTVQTLVARGTTKLFAALKRHFLATARTRTGSSVEPDSASVHDVEPEPPASAWATALDMAAHVPWPQVVAAAWLAWWSLAVLWEEREQTRLLQRLLVALEQA